MINDMIMSIRAKIYLGVPFGPLIDLFSIQPCCPKSVPKLLENALFLSLEYW